MEDSTTLPLTDSFVLNMLVYLPWRDVATARALLKIARELGAIPLISISRRRHCTG